MTKSWQGAVMGDVQAGDQVRLASGRELLVSRIEAPFFGNEEMLALVEETESSWFKQPARRDAPVEILRS